MARKLQIDVKGPTSWDKNIVHCVLIVNGTDTSFYMLKTDYDELVTDGFFIRDGKHRDSANLINTTAVYVEQ